jgi:cell division transport system permease protein
LGKIIADTIRFLSIIFLSSFFILILNYYYQVESYVSSLYDELNIVVFFKNDIKDINVISDEIAKKETLFVKEIVDSSQSYLKAVERNPFLKDISTIDDVESIGSYAIVLPKETFDENYLLEVRNNIEAIDGVDEIVFDAYSFNQYRKLKNLLMLCQKTFFYFFIVVGVLVVFKIIFTIFVQESAIKKIVRKFCFYFMATSLGFFIIWMLSIFVQYDLSVNKPLILFVIPFVTVFGLIFDNKL